MTTTTNTTKTPAVTAHNGHDASIAPPVTDQMLFKSGIEQFISDVEAIIADEDHYYQPPFTLPDSLLYGVESAYDKMWPLLMEMIRLLRRSKSGRNASDNEKFHQFALKLVKYILYAEGMGAVERAASTSTIVRPDSTFNGN